jgi:hypothetical protein
MTLRIWRRRNLMDRIFKTARDLRRRLGTSEKHSQLTMTWISGKKRKGWFLTCVRLSDAKIAMKYVADY